MRRGGVLGAPLEHRLSRIFHSNSTPFAYHARAIAGRLRGALRYVPDAVFRNRGGVGVWIHRRATAWIRVRAARRPAPASRPSATPPRRRSPADGPEIRAAAIDAVDIFGSRRLWADRGDPEDFQAADAAAVLCRPSRRIVVVTESRGFTTRPSRWQDAIRADRPRSAAAPTTPLYAVSAVAAGTAFVGPEGSIQPLDAWSRTGCPSATPTYAIIGNAMVLPFKIPFRLDYRNGRLWGRASPTQHLARIRSNLPPRAWNERCESMESSTTDGCGSPTCRRRVRHRRPHDHLHRRAISSRRLDDRPLVRSKGAARSVETSGRAADGARSRRRG